MSKLDDLIKELELKKLKIQFLQQILDSTKDYKAKMYEPVKEDVVEILEKFVNSEVEKIEGHAEVAIQPKAATPKVKDGETTTEIAPKKTEPKMNPQDALQFSLKYRHLSGKRLKVELNGDQVFAEVVGCDVPYLVMRRDSGQIIKVLPETIDTQGAN